MALGVSLCVTAGGRPDLLEETLGSLLPYNGQFFDAAFVTNDRGDSETNAVVRARLPSATILNHVEPLGQHRSIDEMYALVRTPYIFHCEDDWMFDPVPFVAVAHAAIVSDESIAHVSMRETGSYQTHHATRRRFTEPVAIAGGAVRFLAEDGGWNGYSFNPSLVRADVWRSLGPFEKYATEQDVNDAVESSGMKRAFLVPGTYYHIGDGRHVAPATETPSARPLSALIESVRRLVRVPF